MSVPDVPRNAEGWPVGEFSVTDNDGTVHEATQWWDDDFEEVRTRCKKYLKTTIDWPTKPTSCLLCMTYPALEDDDG